RAHARAVDDGPRDAHRHAPGARRDQPRSEASGLSVPPGRRFPLEALAPLAAVLLALLAGAGLIAAGGQSPLEVYGLLAREALGTGYGVGQRLFKTTPLLFAGLSVAVAFRAGLFNVGAEGQMYLGGFAAALVGAYLPLPAPYLMPLALLAAALAGAFWGA